MSEEPEEPKPETAPPEEEPELGTLETNDDVTAEVPRPTMDEDATGEGSFGPEFHYEETSDPDTQGTRARLFRLGRRLLDPREVADDTKKVLGSVLEGSDWAKTEIVKLAAREVRHYLDELRVAEDLKELMTNHTLKVNAEFSLVPHPTAPEPVVQDDDSSGEE